jgi:predicted secreted hydrolase
MMAGRAGLVAFFVLLGFLLASSRPARTTWAFDPDQEEGIHGGVEVEWWYHFGFLTDDAGKEWAVFSAFFRAQKKGAPLTRYLLYDLLDLKTGEHDYRSRLGAEAMALMALGSGKSTLDPPHAVIPGTPIEKPGDPLKLTYGESSLERTGERTYRLKVGEVHLELRATSPAMPIEGTGLTGVERPEDMHYYTIPRLEATGRVKGRAARGALWYDHQWGASWTGPSFGWSWWGLQLDDGSAVNAYVLRETNPARVRKAVMTRGGRVFPLEATPLEWWESPIHVRYPVAWRLVGGGLDVTVEPAFKSREVMLVGNTDTLWEGPVRVTGTVGGRGFQELVGYARERKRSE